MQNLLLEHREVGHEAELLCAANESFQCILRPYMMCVTKALWIIVTILYKLEYH